MRFCNSKCRHIGLEGFGWTPRTPWSLDMPDEANVIEQLQTIWRQERMFAGLQEAILLALLRDPLAKWAILMKELRNAEEDK